MSVIYAASIPSLALLEYLCIKGAAVGNKPWHMITYEIADESVIASLDPGNLPPNWADLPRPKNTQDFGRQWLEDKQEPFLKVPSARLSLKFYPLEFNVLINPEYDDIQNLCKVADTATFNYLLSDWK